MRTPGKAKGELVAHAAFMESSYEATCFLRDWRADASVTVRTFRRVVRADRLAIGMIVFVVRRKVVDA